MLEATAYLPAQDRDGRQLPPEAIEEVIALLTARFGQGVLWDEQRGLGPGWERFGHPIVRPLIVVLESEDLPELRRTLARVGRMWKQTVMYLKVGRPEMETIPAERAEVPECGSGSASWLRSWERNSAWQRGRSEQMGRWLKHWRPHQGPVRAGAAPVPPAPHFPGSARAHGPHSEIRPAHAAALRRLRRKQ